MKRKDDRGKYKKNNEIPTQQAYMYKVLISL